MNLHSGASPNPRNPLRPVFGRTVALACENGEAPDLSSRFANNAEVRKFYQLAVAYYEAILCNLSSLPKDSATGGLARVLPAATIRAGDRRSLRTVIFGSFSEFILGPFHFHGK